MLRKLLFGCALVLLPQISFADYLQGMNALDRKDYATALRELRAAAEHGDGNAQVSLGLMYYNGRGVPTNYVEAMRWFKKAALRGDADALVILGEMYRNGNGVPESYAEAARWYQKAAEQGHPRAQGLLAAGYATGKGIPRNYVLAYKWASLAAASGDELARNLMDSLEQQMSNEDIADAQRLAAGFKPRGRCWSNDGMPVRTLLECSWAAPRSN
ncbi:hypothetical protein CGK74_16495 [Thauera propionica]|uniref:Sel1 repeat family protein n=1 Tax=Thauera propionica TaxID=2019431 RepID=A0A235EWD5_9RHOO|nr:tetratricopeptide repeat protein [Thauera propionica]OYD52735.1 hypothetical protein CGK74_16495 [Thauera propionica]